MTWLDPSLPVALAMAALALTAIQKGRLAFAVTGEEDADMKIAPSGGSARYSAGEAAEEAEAEAREYLRQKSAGNISLARALGEQFAALLIAEAKDHFDPWPEGMAEALRAHHSLLLLSYVVNRVVADLSQNSILAQTTLNVFYSEMEEKAPSLDKYIRDMASYSLYILCERSQQCAADEVGRIFARLCGDKDNDRLIADGQARFLDYYKRCSALHGQTVYAPV